MKKRFPLILVALAGMPMVAVALLTVTKSFATHDLPTYGQVPSFELTERSGQTFGTKELQGKVWVASFIFTRCTTQCPTICAQVKKLGKRFRFKENFRLVSITVDPTHDTAEALENYATGFEADPYKWLFLTGDSNEIQGLVKNGFRLAAVTEGSAGDILHSSKLVLVDSMGRIRGYYDGTDDQEIKQLMRDTKQLLRQTF